jgi:hypothetical protein
MKHEMIDPCSTQSGKSYRPILFRKFVEQRLLWITSTKTGPREIGCESIDWIQLAQSRIRWWPFVNTVNESLK